MGYVILLLHSLRLPYNYVTIDHLKIIIFPALKITVYHMIVRTLYDQIAMHCSKYFEPDLFSLLFKNKAFGNSPYLFCVLFINLFIYSRMPPASGLRCEAPQGDLCSLAS